MLSIRRRSTTVRVLMSWPAGSSKNSSPEPSLTATLWSWCTVTSPIASGSDITACHSMLCRWGAGRSDAAHRGDGRRARPSARPPRPGRPPAARTCRCPSRSRGTSLRGARSGNCARARPPVVRRAAQRRPRCRERRRAAVRRSTRRLGPRRREGLGGDSVESGGSGC